MKKLLLTSLMLIGTSNVFAQSLTCSVDVLLADKAGYLMPSEEKLSITTELVSDGVPSIKKCQNESRGNLQLSLCASEAEFIGGIKTALVIQVGSNPESLTVSSSLLGTLKNDKGLVEIISEKSVLTSLINKMFEAGIDVQMTLENDSASLDDSVKKGIEKGVLTPNEPVVISIGECKLSK